MHRHFACPLACSVALLLEVSFTASGAAALEVGGDPRVDPNDFRITAFASGLDFPLAMAELSDGALLVGVSHDDGSPGAIWFDTDSELVRFEDADADGVADGPGVSLFSGLTGVVSALRLVGDLVVVTTYDSLASRLWVLRQGAGPGDPFTALGSIDFVFPSGWGHRALEVEARTAPGLADHLEVLVSVGSDAEAAASTRTVSLGGLAGGSLVGEAIHRIVFDDSSSPLSVASVEQVASGVRNPFGMAFSRDGSELFFADNGYRSAGVILMSDEFDRLPTADLGGPVEDFGFPASYVDYVSGAVVGGAGVLPFLAFRPLAGGEESVGPAKVTLAPPLFPPALRHGVFVGFHGQFSSNPQDNDINPVVWLDPVSGDHFHFVSAGYDAIGHPDGLLATGDSLYVADFTDVSGYSGFGTGTIYQVQALPPQVPALGALGLAVLAAATLGTAWRLWPDRRPVRRAEGRAEREAR